MIVKVNLRGGIISPGTLLQILKIVQQAGVNEVSFGGRQQLLFKTKSAIERGSHLPIIVEEFNKLGLDFEQDEDKFPNIISSYCAEEVFPTGQWLSEGIYQDIFDGFDFKPQLKVNISDSLQSFTPFFIGNLNFIASEIPNFWFCFVRFKQSNKIFRFPILIYTLEITKVCQRIEEVIFGNGEMDENDVYEKVIAKGEIISQVILHDLVLPKFSLPYYEGFNRYGEKTWLGIYRRGEKFSIDFLKEVCEICLATKVGQMCSTPWKSLIIKNIENIDRKQWDNLLGKYGINVRHAANELNWQLEDLSIGGLNLKKQIIREFDGYDVRTFGLCFAVQTKPKSEVFGSVIIKKRSILFGLSKVYDVYHTVDFNPNTRETVLFESNINKTHVAEILQRLTKRYYAQLVNVDEINTQSTKIEKVKIEKKLKIHQCPNCFTIYDSNFGDILNEIPVGINFKSLPTTYNCPTCETPKIEFEEVEFA
jgi:rubredoxin